MLQKTYVPQGQDGSLSHIGATFEALASTISSRRDAGEETMPSRFPPSVGGSRRDAGEESYTSRLLADLEYLLSKVAEEAGEVVEAAQEAAQEGEEESARGSEAGQAGQVGQEGKTDHLRYEIADLTYHLLVVLERFDIPLDELAAELNMRMRDEERPAGGILLFDEYVKRGK